MLAKSKLNSIEVLISMALIDSVISHDEFVLTNNVLKEYKKNEKRNKKFKNLAHVAKVFDCTRQFIEDFSLFIKQCYYIIFLSVEKIKKVKIRKLQEQKSGRIMILSKCSVCDSK